MINWVFWKKSPEYPDFSKTVHHQSSKSTLANRLGKIYLLDMFYHIPDEGYIVSTRFSEMWAWNLSLNPLPVGGLDN